MWYCLLSTLPQSHPKDRSSRNYFELETTISTSLFHSYYVLSRSVPSSVSAGWGEMPNVHSKAESSWGEPSSPSALVDNGTAAWGKPPSSGSGWGDQPAEPPVTFGRASAPAAAPALCKPGKPDSALEKWVRLFSWEGYFPLNFKNSRFRTLSSFYLYFNVFATSGTWTQRSS